jgi:hypothetical protein
MGWATLLAMFHIRHRVTLDKSFVSSCNASDCKSGISKNRRPTQAVKLQNNPLNYLAR